MTTLCEIPCGQWPRLCNLYRNHCTDPNGYNLLQNYIKWTSLKEKDAHDEQDDKSAAGNNYVKCLTLDNSNWQDDGTFLLIHKYDTNIDVYFNTLNDDLERLTMALECLKLPSSCQDGTEVVSFDGYPVRLRPVVLKFLEERENLIKDLWEHRYDCYHVKKASVDEYTIDVPTGIRLGQLKVQHAEQINDAWIERDNGTLSVIRDQIRFNTNVGAFDDSGNLVAWCLRTPQGFIGLLHVLETHQRRGLGAILVKTIAKQIVAEGEEVLTQIAADNIASCNLFKKLNFYIYDHIYWTLMPI